MLLEKTLAGYGDTYNRENYIKDTEQPNMGLLDTSSRGSGTTSRLITAMLADRTFPCSSSAAPHASYTPSSISGQHNTASMYKMNLDQGANLSNQYKTRMWPNPASVTESSSGPSTTPMLPVGSPDSINNNTDTGYRSYDDEGGYTSNGYIPSRKQREFIPENKKDDGYWEKRRKNNEAARRSRQKRRVHDMALETRIMDITRDNCKLREELGLIKKKFGLPPDETFSDDRSESMANRMHSPVHTSPQRISTSRSSVHTEYPSAHYPSGVRNVSPTRNRSMSVSGAMQTPYLPSYPSHTPAVSQHQSFEMPSDSYYINNRDQPESDLKPYSAKYDVQSPFHLKSTKEDNHYQSHSRADEHVRPSYSSAVPHNQSSPYNSALPVSSHKSYWIPTTDLTSSDDDEYECYDDRVQEQPLSLVKKRTSTENESSEDLSNSSSRASNSPTNNTSALPLKLRHKVSIDSPPTPESPPANAPAYSNGLAQLSDIALAHSNWSSSYNDYPANSGIDSFKIRPRSYKNPRSIFDIKYVERRKRNNEAARKCRENRKQLTKIREVKSGYLVNENGKLKDELMGLQEEMRELRDLLEKKRQSRDDDNTSDKEQDDQDDDADTMKPMAKINGYSRDDATESRRRDSDVYMDIDDHRVDDDLQK